MRLLLALILIVACAKKTQKPEDTPPAAAAHKPADPPPVARADQAPTLSPNAPEDKPIAGRRTPEQEATIKELGAQDMKKWPDVNARFSKGLPTGEHLYVTTTLSSPGRTESVFIAVRSIEGSKITGVISSEITNVDGYKVNDRYTLQESAVTDWLISKPDGSEEGNLVGNYLDTLQ